MEINNSSYIISCLQNIISLFVPYMQTNTNLPIFKLVFIATLFTLSCIFTNNTTYTHIYAHTNLTTSPNLMRNSTVSKNHWKTSPHCNSLKVTQKLLTTLRSGPLRIPKSISSANAKFRLLSRLIPFKRVQKIFSGLKTNSEHPPEIKNSKAIDVVDLS